MVGRHTDNWMICIIAAEAAPDHVLPALFDRYGQMADWLSPGRALDIGPISDAQIAAQRADIASTLAGHPIDHFCIPVTGRRKKLLATDMDSTVITIECIDELADLVGKKHEIATITARAMAGELNFEQSLIERVASLAGVSTFDVAAICQTRVDFMPGARELVATMNAHGAKCTLLSGGFKLFTSFVAQSLGFDSDYANELEVSGGRLTGAVIEPIFGPQAKQETLTRLAKEFSLNIADTIAVGDGANDRDMLKAAGLGVAFRAKAPVRRVADIRINHTDLRSVLYAQGYNDTDIARATDRC